jgi:hypothetical protein
MLRIPLRRHDSEPIDTAAELAGKLNAVINDHIANSTDKSPETILKAIDMVHHIWQDDDPTSDATPVPFTMGIEELSGLRVGSAEWWAQAEQNRQKVNRIAREAQLRAMQRSRRPLPDAES